MWRLPEAATETPKEFDQQIVNSAGTPLFVIPGPPDPNQPGPRTLSRQVQACLGRKSRSSAPQ